MNILITGANLINKGAQSMLFVTVDQMKRLFPSATVYYATYRGDCVSRYNFERMYWDPFVKKAFLEGSYSKKAWIKQLLKNISKFLMRKTEAYNSIKTSLKLIPQVDLIIDISGYALADKWGFDYNEAYLDNIRIARKLNIPICLMPQSFGPFRYENEMNESKSLKLISDIKELLEYPRIVFAREKESKKYLEELGLQNIRISNDLVLQSSDINPQNVFNNPSLRNNKEFSKEKAKVALIPNQQITNRGFKDLLFSEYEKAIIELEKHNYSIVIMQHSGEDTALCLELYDRFKSHSNVELVREDLNCYEYSQYIRGFDFVISSRFHAAVHALKEGIPTITIGWAIKYKELMESVGQERFAFDITSTFNPGQLKGMALDMIDNLEACRSQISSNVRRIQSESCFNTVKEVISAK